MKNYIRCPRCGHDSLTKTLSFFSGNQRYKCEDCGQLVEELHSNTPCSACYGTEFLKTYLKEKHIIYCANCGTIEKSSKLLSGNNLQERLKHKTVIPKDYIIDLQIDFHEFEQGKEK